MKIINHEANGLQIGQRSEDGYVNLTKMAKANGKKLNDYLRLETTKAFTNALYRYTGIPADQLIIKIVKGKNSLRGTWGHPQIAIHCGQWCSAEFAVLVSNWVVQWMTTDQNPIVPTSNAPTDLLAEINRLEKLIVSIRSQARTFHTGSHQPTDDHLVKSLHTISHNQLSIINSAIQRLEKLKRVAEMNSELEVNADIEISSAPSKPNQQPPAKPTMKGITAANFIDNIPVVTKEATVRFTVDLPESMHRELSILSARTGRSKADIIRMVLDDVLKDIDE